MKATLEKLVEFLDIIKRRTLENIKIATTEGNIDDIIVGDEADVFTCDDISDTIHKTQNSAMKALDSSFDVVTNTMVSIVQQLLDEAKIRGIEQGMDIDYTKISTQGLMEDSIIVHTSNKPRASTERTGQFGLMSDMDTIESLQNNVESLSKELKETKEIHAATVKELEDCKKQLTMKIRDTPQFKALEQMLATKNEQIKELKSKLDEEM